MHSVRHQHVSRHKGKETELFLHKMNQSKMSHGFFSVNLTYLLSSLCGIGQPNTVPSVPCWREMLSFIKSKLGELRRTFPDLFDNTGESAEVAVEQNVVRIRSAFTGGCGQLRVYFVNPTAFICSGNVATH